MLYVLFSGEYRVYYVLKFAQTYLLRSQGGGGGGGLLLWVTAKGFNKVL